MQVVLPDKSLPATLTLNPDATLSDEEYFDFCMANPGVGFERTRQGKIIIVPPAGGESDYQSLESASALLVWANRDGRGKAFGSSVQFMLPGGAALSPDAAWVSNARLAPLTRDQRRRFPPVCPEFVVEVMSPSDRLKAAKQKMTEWMAAGVELGWLIEPDHETVYVYRAGEAEPEKRTGMKGLAGEGPVAGFELDLTNIWAGL